MAGKYCLILCFLANVATIYCQTRIHVKNGNSYEIIFGDTSKSILTSVPGYVQIANNLLEEFKNGKILAAGLNKFNAGIEQYFLYQLYEKEAVKIASESPKPESISEPVLLRNETTKSLSFVNITLYGLGLPSVRKTSKATLVYDGLTSVSEYQANINFKSDAIILTGNILLNDGSTYFFVYNLKDTSHRVEFNGFKDIGAVQYVKSSLQFTSEELIHTYDSSYENYPQVNEAIAAEFYDAFQHSVYLRIFDLTTQCATSSFHEQNVKFIGSYKSQLLKSIIDSAVQFISLKQNYFEATSINFTTPTPNRIFVITYKDIKLEGVLNYKNYELTESKIEPVGDNFNISNTIQFLYPEEGDKQAFVSFIFSDGRQENAKKFKVKSIQIITIYNSPIAKLPRGVYPSKDIFFNGSPFLVKIELDNFDPTYQFVIKHLADDISRAIQNTLSESV